MSNADKPQKYLQPECLDPYGLKPCTAEYLERMRQVVFRDGLDIKCLFEKHDPLEWGTVSEYLFKCVMHERFLCQCGFTQEIVQLITEFFLTPDGMVCYQRLHALMTSTENIAQQLRDCASRVAIPQESQAPLRYCGGIRVFGTDPCIPPILERLRTAYWRLRIKLTDLFRCCDPRCTGLVDEEKFQCMLKQSLVPESGITERQLDAVTNYYRACGLNIDYRRMAAMFDSTLSIQEQIQQNYITKPADVDKAKAVNQLCETDELRVKEIWCKIVQRADRYIMTTLSAIFHKFAQRQSGETTVPHLRRFFTYMNATISESDFSLLCKKYATNDYNINFLALIEDLDDTFHATICPQPPPNEILGADGPGDVENFVLHGGAGSKSSAYNNGACPCAVEGEYAKSACLPSDSTRFYEGGPVCGGAGKVPVYGREYVCKRLNANPGQRYGGCCGLSQAAGKPTGIPSGMTCGEQVKQCVSERTDLRLLMERLQQFLYRYRIRAKDFFKDFDPLNSGFISANRFRRGLNDMGVGVLGRMNLKEGEFDALINYYRMVDDPSMACWRKFEYDIESIFIQKGIEKFPSVLTPSPKCIVDLPDKGVISMDDIPLHINQLAKCAVARLRHRVYIENCNIKYFFQGFDKVNTGHVSRQQFKQTLSMLNYNFSAEELEAMSVKFCDQYGFNYLKLMDEIEPKDEDPGWYTKYRNGRLYQLNKLPPPPKWVENDIQRVMYKIQARMVRCRPKLKAFLIDHDIFTHDRIKILDFHRAMDRAGFELTPREVEVLTCCFRSPDDPTEIEWRCLNDAIETCFTLSNLEKGPRITPYEWHPLREMDYDKQLTKQDYCLLTDGMRRLSRRVSDRRILIKPMFFDFDIPKCGLVSQDQFHRVLHTVELAGLLTHKEFDAICKRFLVIRGRKRDIDYVEFLAQLDAIISVDPITLEEQSPTGVEWYKQQHNCCPSET